MKPPSESEATGAKESVEYLISLLKVGTTTIDPCEVPTSVYPSGLLAATMLAPIPPPAPAL